MVLESLNQLYGHILHIFLYDTEAVVRRTILRENLLIRLHPKQEREAIYAAAQYQSMLIKALKDLDWEVKEAALGCLGYTLDVVINDCSLGGIEKFLKTLNIYGIVDALILCTRDYERRFLHKTYVILHKLHGFLSSNFHSDELKHKKMRYIVFIVSSIL